MYGPYSKKCERFSWNDLKHQGVVNLDGRPSVGLYSYVSTLSLPPGSTPTVARDPLSGVQVLAHLTSVPAPEPFMHKLTPNRLEGFEISAIVYDFMQYSLYYRSLSRRRSRLYMRRYFPNNPCTHYKPKFIRRLPKELHDNSSANKTALSEDADETCLSHDQLMQHLEKLEKQEQDLNESSEIFTKTTPLKKCRKRGLGARGMDEEAEFEAEDGELTEEEEEANSYKNDTKKASANKKEDSDSSDGSNDDEDTDKDSEMGTMDDDDYYGLYSGNESRDGYGSDDDGAFYE